MTDSREILTLALNTVRIMGYIQEQPPGGSIALDPQLQQSHINIKQSM